jgi:hypothetical protein
VQPLFRQLRSATESRHLQQGWASLLIVAINDRAHTSLGASHVIPTTTTTDKDRASDRITGTISNGHLSHLDALGQEVLRLRKALQRGSDLGRRQRRKPGPVVVVVVIGGWGKGDIDSKVMIVRARVA